ncbi:MAG TPA: 6-phosphogluconolactonase [Bryobacteraceae bacterium]|jgi:6-phosphogluconolactonase|nr:6-phosphogluconolactonase [Bryobacteraceae bacterium]
MSDLRVFPDAHGAAEHCAAEVLQHLRDSPRSTLAISGGSSPKPMFEIFAATQFDWNRVQLFWVDERCVPATDPQSNFKLANDLWLAPAKFPASNIHRVQTERDPEDAAEVYSDELRLVFGEGIPQFDVIHRGMGPDAHTASLFPGEPLIDDRTGLAGAVYVEKLNSHRVTLLPAVLLAAKHTVLLVTGPDKAQPLSDVLYGPHDPKKFPCQLTERDGGDVAWFLDEAAASKLRR